MTFPSPDKELPYLTTKQMIEVDRAMMEDYKIELIQMMENAGRALAHLARDRFLGGDPRGKKVVVLAGTGGNGGGALVGGRRLHNYGAFVQVITTKSYEDFRPVPAHQLDILLRMNVPVSSTLDGEYLDRPDLILDGIIGYSLKGAPRGSAAVLIQWANEQDIHLLALDAPSGMDAATGIVYEPAIKATATLTLALPKEGLSSPDVRAYVGELYLADISVPPELYAQLNLDLEVGPIFAQGDILSLG